jgi:hypothetical protein
MKSGAKPGMGEGRRCDRLLRGSSVDSIAVRERTDSTSLRALPIGSRWSSLLDPIGIQYGFSCYRNNIKPSVLEPFGSRSTLFDLQAERCRSGSDRPAREAAGDHHDIPAYRRSFAWFAVSPLYATARLPPPPLPVRNLNSFRTRGEGVDGTIFSRLVRPAVHTI